MDEILDRFRIRNFLHQVSQQGEELKNIHLRASMRMMLCCWVTPLGPEPLLCLCIFSSMSGLFFHLMFREQTAWTYGVCSLPSVKRRRCSRKRKMLLPPKLEWSRDDKICIIQTNPQRFIGQVLKLQFSPLNLCSQPRTAPKNRMEGQIFCSKIDADKSKIFGEKNYLV